MPQTRIILHADMDAFFASVEQRDNPELRGRAVIVGGSSRRLPAGEKWVVARRYPPNTRGVVTTASYEARKFGVRSAMPMAQACRLAPDALVVPGRMHVYAETSRRIMEVLRTITPDVQPISIDEAFADITGSAHLFGGPEGAARELKRRVREAVNLTISVGVSCNKFLAKVASDMHKPDGLTVIEADAAPDLLAPMPVSVIPGVGPKAGQELARLGVRTILDLRRAPRARKTCAGSSSGWAGWCASGCGWPTATTIARCTRASVPRASARNAPSGATSATAMNCAGCCWALSKRRPARCARKACSPTA